MSENIDLSAAILDAFEFQRRLCVGRVRARSSVAGSAGSNVNV
jgi:hypothetical protein